MEVIPLATIDAERPDSLNPSVDGETIARSLLSRFRET